MGSLVISLCNQWDANYGSTEATARGAKEAARATGGKFFVLFQLYNPSPLKYHLKLVKT